MKHQWQVAVAIGTCTCAAAVAQNLVPNPGFEAQPTCPSTNSNLSDATDWFSPTLATPDAFNVCATTTLVHVPLSVAGTQAPHSGNAYAGIIVFSAGTGGANYREYLEAKLSQALIANRSYTVSYHVSLADGAGWAVDRIGAYFSAGPVGPLATNTALTLSPQVAGNNSGMLLNAAGWDLLQGTLVAAGGEDHIVIGNFYADAQTNRVAAPDVGFGESSVATMAYYFVDDVSVELVGNGCFGDLSGDGFVDGRDLGELLADWGLTNTSGDLDGDGLVDGGDLAQMLAGWGVCD